MILLLLPYMAITWYTHPFYTIYKDLSIHDKYKYSQL